MEPSSSYKLLVSRTVVILRNTRERRGAFIEPFPLRNAAEIIAVEYRNIVEQNMQY